MRQYKCSVCGYIYDESPGSEWDVLPSNWKCPTCGAPKSAFVPVESTPPDDGSGGISEPVSKAPMTNAQRLVLAHRIIGGLFVLLYLFFFFSMLPRLWSYQIEFSAQAAIHIALAFAIGAMLFMKVLIVRYFKSIGPGFILVLGVAIFTTSVVMIGLSAPFAIHESIKSDRDDLFSPANLDRIESLLIEAGYQESDAAVFALRESLVMGRSTLRTSCVECHDLKTVLARPRTPTAWRQTVQRMADRSVFEAPLEKNAQGEVVAYLVALSPRLRESRSEQIAQEARSDSMRGAVAVASEQGLHEVEFELPRAETIFESKCGVCHPASDIEKTSFSSEDEVRALVSRMAGYGAEGTKEEFAMIIEYLDRMYLDPTEP